MQKRVPIFIPSHAEVLQQSRPQAPPSLFRPSSSTPHPSNLTASTSNQIAEGHAASTSNHVSTDGDGAHQPETFTQAFSFVKKTEFYSPPPAAPILLPTTSSASASAGGPGPKPEYVFRIPAACLVFEINHHLWRVLFSRGTPTKLLHLGVCVCWCGREGVPLPRIWHLGCDWT